MASAPIHVLKTGIVDTQTVADSVIPGKIRAGFGRRNEIVRSDSVFGMGQTDLMQRTSEIFVYAHPSCGCRPHSRIQAGDKTFLRSSDSYSFNRPVEIPNEFGHGTTR